MSLRRVCLWGQCEDLIGDPGATKPGGLRVFDYLLGRGDGGWLLTLTISREKGANGYPEVIMI